MEKTYKIKEFAEQFGLAADTLRYYEKKGLLPSHRAPNGYRYYTADDGTKIMYIKLLRAFGFSIQQIQDSIAIGTDSFQDAMQNETEKIDEQIRFLQSKRKRVSYCAEVSDRIQEGRLVFGAEDVNTEFYYFDQMKGIDFVQYSARGADIKELYDLMPLIMPAFILEDINSGYLQDAYRSGLIISKEFLSHEVPELHSCESITLHKCFHTIVRFSMTETSQDAYEILKEEMQKRGLHQTGPLLAELLPTGLSTDISWLDCYVPI